MSIGSRSFNYFAAAVVASATALLVLPLTTRILGPADYGTFALLTAVMAVGISLATLGSGYLVYNRVPVLTAPQRAALLSTVTAVAGIVALTWAALVVTALVAARGVLPAALAVPTGAAMLAAVSAALTPLWVIATDLLTLEGRARSYAVASIARSVVTAAATLISLFVFDMGLLALFVGDLAGSALLALAAMLVLRPHLSPRLDRRWLREQWAMAGNFFLAQVTERAYAMIERVLLSMTVGLHALGLFTHSQAYRDFTAQGVKSVARGVWPETLREARDAGSQFPATGRTWAAVHVGVAALGVVLATTGDTLISLLTNDKFTAAWIYLGPWFVILLVQNTARPHLGVIYALGEGRKVANANSAANAVGLALLLVLVPVLGPWGAVLAYGLQTLAYRYAVRRLAQRYRPVPFQDRWALLGILVVAVAVLAEVVLVPSPVMGAVLAVVLAGGFALAARRVLLDALRTLLRGRLLDALNA